MRELYRRIVNLSKFNGRDWAVFLLSLLLAFTVWLMHNLSLTYSTYLSVPVIAQCEILGHSAYSSESSRIVARCRTTGYEALLHKMTASNRPLVIRMDRADLKQKGDDIFYLGRGDMSDYANDIYGEQTKIEFFVTDTLFFRFPKEAYRKVPVVPLSTIKLNPQYINKGDMKVIPDSIYIYGEPNHLENINKVHTKHMEFLNVSSSLQGVAAIEPIDGIRMSETEVHYHMDVTRYVEILLNVPLMARNVPLDVELKYYPSYVAARFVCDFPQVTGLDENVEFYIDYEEFLKSPGGECVVHHTPLPSGVFRVILDNPVVECIANQRRR